MHWANVPLPLMFEEERRIVGKVGIGNRANVTGDGSGMRRDERSSGGLIGK
jgi:hypothetical protein